MTPHSSKSPTFRLRTAKIVAQALHRLAEQLRQTPVSATAIVMILAIGLNPVTHTNTSAQINWSNPRSRRVQNRNTRAGTTAPLH
jgi:hypothetical protein